VSFVAESLTESACRRLFYLKRSEDSTASTTRPVPVAEAVDQRGLIGLKDGDRLPKQVRRPQWSLVMALVAYGFQAI
jgi:hypothetical protein